MERYMGHLFLRIQELDDGHQWYSVPMTTISTAHLLHEKKEDLGSEPNVISASFAMGCSYGHWRSCKVFFFVQKARIVGVYPMSIEIYQKISHTLHLSIDVH